MMEMTRAGVIAAEAGSYRQRSDDWAPDERSFVALRGLMPKWIPRSFELLQPDRRRRLHDHAVQGGHRGAAWAETSSKYYQARNAAARARIRRSGWPGT